MTVENITPITRKVYTGPGEYTFTFKVYDATTVKATHISAAGVETVLVYGIDYTVTLNSGTDGGHIDTTSPASSGGYLDVFRELQFSQDLDLVGQGKFDPETLERGFDEAIMRLQQMQATIDDLVITSNWRGDWATGTPYYIKDLLRGPTGDWYVCLSEHTSDVFSTDLATGYWALALDISTIGGSNVPDPSAGVDEQVIKVLSGAYILGTINTNGLADSAVTLAKLASGVIPVGSILTTALSTPPAGWLECDGSAISRTTYATLFAAISDDYGAGDGSTTFNLPDYRGQFLRGWAHGQTTDPDRASRTNRGDGTTGDHVGTKQADELKSHLHGVPYNSSTTAGGNAIGGSNASLGWYDSNSNNTGGNETRPININVMFCIKY